MKNITKGLATVLLGGMLLGLNTSCKKLGDFGDTNVNPNGSSSVATGTLISTIQTRLGNNLFATIGTGTAPTAETLSGFYCQYFGETTYPGASLYARSQNAEAPTYSGILYDCKVVINRNTDPATMAEAANSGSNASQAAMTRIMKAYIFWTLTDKYGDLPYSEALQGAGNLTPKYDTQESIYKDLLKEVTEAVDQFDPAGASVGNNDIIYAGDITKWQKFGNSLRMLMALRLSKKYPAAGDYAATQFSAGFNHPAGFITNNADNFQLYYPGNVLQYQTPWSSTGNSADVAESKTMTDALTAMGDSRITAFGSTPNGVPYCLAGGAQGTFAKILAPAFKTPAGKMVYIGAGDVLLAAAEGIERGWVAGMTTTDAEADYNAGVTASFGQWSLSVPAGYLALGSPANYQNGTGANSIGGATVPGTSAITNTKISRINLQQWFSFYPNGGQGWANWRRTGVPDLRPTINATGAGTIPRRYIYGATDYSLNLDMVTAAATAIGGDTQENTVWWDR